MAYGPPGGIKVDESDRWPDGVHIKYALGPDAPAQTNQGNSYYGVIARRDLQQSPVPVMWKWDNWPRKDRDIGESQPWGSSPPDATYVDFECYPRTLITRWITNPAPDQTRP